MRSEIGTPTPLLQSWPRGSGGLQGWLRLLDWRRDPTPLQARDLIQWMDHKHARRRS